MDQNFREAYYRLVITTDNGGGMVSSFTDFSDDRARLEAMTQYVKQAFRHGFILQKYDQRDICGTLHLIGKYEESTAIG